MHGNLSLYPVTFLSTTFLHRFCFHLFSFLFLGLLASKWSTSTVYIMTSKVKPTDISKRWWWPDVVEDQTRWDLQHSRHVKVDRWLQIDILCHDRPLSFVRIIDTQWEVLRTKEVLRRPFGSEVASTYCRTVALRLPVDNSLSGAGEFYPTYPAHHTDSKVLLFLAGMNLFVILLL